MRRSSADLADGNESPVNVGDCPSRGQRFSECGASGVLFKDQRVVEIEDDGVQHAQILASPSAPSAEGPYGSGPAHGRRLRTATVVSSSLRSGSAPAWV